MLGGNLTEASLGTAKICYYCDLNSKKFSHIIIKSQSKSLIIADIMST